MASKITVVEFKVSVSIETFPDDDDLKQQTDLVQEELMNADIEDGFITDIEVLRRTK